MHVRQHLGPSDTKKYSCPRIYSCSRHPYHAHPSPVIVCRYNELNSASSMQRPPFRKPVGPFRRPVAPRLCLGHSASNPNEHSVSHIINTKETFQQIHIQHDRLRTTVLGTGHHHPTSTTPCLSAFLVYSFATGTWYLAVIATHQRRRSRRITDV